MTDDESILSLFTVPAVFLSLCPFAEFPTHFEGTGEKQFQTQHEEHCITLNEQRGAVQHDRWSNHRKHFTSTAVPSSIKCKNKPLMEESDGVGGEKSMMAYFKSWINSVFCGQNVPRCLFRVSPVDSDLNCSNIYLTY